MIFVISMLVLLASQIALGEVPGPYVQPILEKASGLENPICTVIEQAGLTWPVFGQVFGMLTATAIFLRPFSNTMLKVALAMTVMPSPIAKSAGKVLWLLGTFAAVPAAGTPKMIQKVIKGEVESPIKKKVA
jgi:hypothetical protein